MLGQEHRTGFQPSLHHAASFLGRCPRLVWSRAFGAFKDKLRTRATVKAPTARSIPAWGAAPGTDTQKNRGLKARPIRLSIPQIPFIEFHAVFFKKCTELILKRLLLVMHFLAIDVIDQRAQVGGPNRERSISSLPRKLGQVMRLSFKPFGRGRFKLFHQIRYVRRAGQSNSEVNVVRDATYARTFTFGVAGNGGKVRVECGTNRSIKNRGAVFCAEDHMDQNKCERLWHRVDYRSGFQPSCLTDNATWGFTPCWYKGAPLALSTSVVAILVFCLLFPSIASAQSPPLHIKIINAQTNKPIHDERLNVALRVEQIGSVAMGTDKNGNILVNYGNATIIRILANMYADCRPRAELYTNYPIDTIVKTGITTGNLCSSASPKAKPGELILFEIPKTFIPAYPAPPLPPPPHSDENPHQPPN
jgi:hypothetical protein